eukprot:TRINITY_DN916_c0_g2_i3.p1 TRINITY_DN916_c0_g2~~TRINITY_DN916_c0_g2_i3.p1  ORF type:complete len:204 (+),score=39.36 TRINITY_DN916_c0_g2_i3:152-763(+)
MRAIYLVVVIATLLFIQNTQAVRNPPTEQYRTCNSTWSDKYLHSDPIQISDGLHLALAMGFAHHNLTCGDSVCDGLSFYEYLHSHAAFYYRDGGDRVDFDVVQELGVVFAGEINGTDIANYINLDHICVVKPDYRNHFAYAWAAVQKGVQVLDTACTDSESERGAESDIIRSVRYEEIEKAYCVKKVEDGFLLAQVPLKVFYI